MQLFANNVTVFLNQTVNSSNTTLVLDDASKLPVLGIGDWFTITFFQSTSGVESNWEIVKVTAVTGNDLTVIRGFDGTTQREWVAGSVGQMRVTAHPLAQVTTDSNNAIATANSADDKADSALSGLTSKASLLDLSASTGSSLVGHIASGTGSVARTLQAKSREKVSVLDKLTPADTPTNNTTAIANAVSLALADGKDTIDLAGQVVEVNSLSNPYGVKFTGGGSVSKRLTYTGINAGNGLVDLTTYTNNSRLFLGQEYLYKLYTRIKNGGALSGAFYGDSTVASGIAAFTASTTGSVLTVTVANSAVAISIGTQIRDAGNSIVYGTVASFGTGTGGIGTYNLVAPHTLGNQTLGTMYLANGGSYAGAQFEPHNLLANIIKVHKGITNPISFTNRAIGGTGISSINPLPDIAAGAGNLDVIFIKSGINDATLGLSTFNTNLRTLLNSIRTATNGGFGNLSIVLLGGNSTYDAATQRTSHWYEQLRGIYEACCRDYQCAYFDTYALSPDSSILAGFSLDQPWADERGIHPLEQFQTQIWGRAIDEILNDSAISSYVESDWVAISLLNSWVYYTGIGAAPVQSKLDRSGRVQLRGIIRNGTATNGTTIGQIANTAHYPKYTQVMPVATNIGAPATVCCLKVQTDGTIVIESAGASSNSIDLGSINFNVK